MKLYPLILTIGAIVAASLAHGQNQQQVTPAPETLPGASTEIYKTVGDVSLPLHIFTPEDHRENQSRPAIVFYFGGGWRSGTPEQFINQCKYLASRGMVAITVEYRVSGRHGTKAISCFQDAKSAMRYVRSNAKRLGIDPDRIAAGGGSAGGHLAGALGTIDGLDDPQDDHSVSAVPNALCLFNPALVVAPVEKKYPIPSERVASIKDRMGVSPESLSPYHNISANQPPAIIFHGNADTTVPIESAKLFAEKSKAKGNRCELLTYEGQPHGFFNYGRAENAMFVATVTEMDTFLNSLGYLKGQPRVEKFLKSIE